MVVIGLVLKGLPVVVVGFIVVVVVVIGVVIVDVGVVELGELKGSVSTSVPQLLFKILEI